jgi:hypothetical protein
MKKVLEVCVDSLASARAAIAGGADRLELCSALSVGGLTPYTALLRQIRAESDIEIRCLMRHRAGDFLYSPEELELLRLQILELKEAGADGFVIGCLTPEGTLDLEAMKPLVAACGDCGITLQNIHGQMLPEVGYHIRKDHQRRGFASEAAAACIRWEDTIQTKALPISCRRTSAADGRRLLSV